MEDPWGVKLELVEDSGPARLHHIHLRTLDPAATLAWYQKMFGAERGKLTNQFDGIRYGDVWLLVQASGGSTEPPDKGYAIDHLRWPENVDGKIAELKTRGATIVSEPRAYGDLRYAIVEAPAGVQIALTQRPTAEKGSR